MNMTLRTLALASTLFVSPCVGHATTLVENFSLNPSTTGWSKHGNPALFAWDSTSRNLAVTWDSSQSNSYFHHDLGLSLSKSNDFLLTFDLRLSHITGGVNSNKPFPFQIAVGLMNLTQATNAGFIRGSGYESPDLVEFDYFPGGLFDPTVSMVMISSSNEFSSGGFTFPLELDTNALFHVTMRYTAADRTLRTFMNRNGMPFGPVKDAMLDASFSDFTVDHVSVSSYSDAGQFPGFEGSVLAQGVVDDLVFAAPPPVMGLTAVGGGLVQFQGTTNWVYHLERTTNFQSWSGASIPVPGTSGVLSLQDTNPPLNGAFYRVKAQWP